MSKEKKHDQAQIDHDEDLVRVLLTPRIYPRLDESEDHDHHAVEHLYFDVGGEG